MCGTVLLCPAREAALARHYVSRCRQVTRHLFPTGIARGLLIPKCGILSGSLEDGRVLLRLDQRLILTWGLTLFCRKGERKLTTFSDVIHTGLN